MTHYERRPDAVWIGHGPNRRQYVPTIWGEPEGNTKWVGTIAEARAVGGRFHFSEDQTEIVCTLPEGYKFGIGFTRESAARIEAADAMLEALKLCIARDPSLVANAMVQAAIAKAEGRT